MREYAKDKVRKIESIAKVKQFIAEKYRKRVINSLTSNIVKSKHKDA